MYCKNCGGLIGENDKFCTHCGTVIERKQDAEANDKSINFESLNGNLSNDKGFGSSDSNFNHNETETKVVVENKVEANPATNETNSNPPSPTPAPMNQVPNNLNVAPPSNENYDATTANKNLKIVVVGVIAIILIAVVGFVGIKFLGKDGDGLANYPTNTVYFNNYAFQIPTNLTYRIADDYLQISDATGSWEIDLATTSGVNYDSIKNYKSRIINSLTSYDLKVEDTSFGNYGGREYLVIKALSNTDYSKAIMAYTSLNSNSVWGVIAMTSNNVYDESLLNKAAQFINTAKSSYVNSIEGIKDFDINLPLEGLKEEDTFE